MIRPSKSKTSARTGGTAGDGELGEGGGIQTFCSDAIRPLGPRAAAGSRPAAALVYIRAMPSPSLGAALTRREDPRLLMGQGRFVGDEPGAGVLHAAFVRSPLAHARLLDLDLAAARRLPGVVGAYAAADLGLPARLAFALLPGAFARPPLAGGAVRFPGEAGGRGGGPTA